MRLYKEMTPDEIREELSGLMKAYRQASALDLKLNMMRGKPAKDQLDLSEGLLHVLENGDECVTDGIETRNYGVPEGIPSARKLFGELLGMPAKNVLVGGNSDLNMIYDTFVRGMLFGLHEGSTPWVQELDRKFLCPSPGYDRHFGIAQQMGFELICVDMLPTGPDMDQVEKLICDPSIKGMFCVPKYSNPTGITYADETVRRIAAMHPAAENFLLVWDNAYVVHDLYEKADHLLNLFDECIKQGTEDMMFTYTSTSKISFPGAGVAAMGMSDANIAWHFKLMSMQSIGPNKVNQLRHMRFLPDVEAVRVHMLKHAELLRPKFEAVLKELDEQIAATGTGTYCRPRGGYFISLDVWNGCAKRVLDLLAAIGVQMTPAGSTYPYKKDPYDRNIRIAPTFITIEELVPAMRLLCLCVRIAACEKRLAQ